MTSRLCFVIPSFRGGGAERATVALANQLSLENQRVDLVVVSADGPYRSEVIGQVNVVDLNAKRLITGIPSLVKYFKWNRPDNVCAVMTHVAVVVRFALMFSRCKSRFFVSERNYPVSVIKRKNVLRELIVGFFVRGAYAHADKVIAVSDNLGQALVDKRGIDPNKICVIKNGVDLEQIFMLSQEPVPEKIEQFIGNRKMVLAVGRLVEQKGYSSLLAAFSIVSGASDVVLVILGEGPLRRKLESEVVILGIQQNVLFPGFLANPFSLMARSDVFVLSSEWEGFPNVLIQALACGASIVSTDCPTGPFEILDGGRYGRLVAVGDVSALAQAISELLTVPKSSLSQRRASDFSIEKVVRAHKELFFGGSCNE